ncbi:MAG TPA: tRNA lysidine(34) synthetase TilS [Candidatus Saccharimonadales bacterium]|nr:tRNA lysidine(34) synthetase TilS [Candidatus Saccharimonadales bacterium]
MQIAVEPGKYVVAVSGGVDSMALLDILRKLPGLDLVVAHYDHGIRADSGEDRKLVASVSARYGLPFESEQGRLGKGASEAAARNARYDFLRRLMRKHGAQAIITAHHQDDLIETAVINLIRGTGRKGLTSLASRTDMLRPLLHTSKGELLEYARSNGLVWREDSTNADEAYLRNYIRRTVLPKLGNEGKQTLLRHIEKAVAHNPVIDEYLQKDLDAHRVDGGLERHWFIMLPHAVACEMMAEWLRLEGIREFDSRTIDRLVTAAKTGRPGRRVDVHAGHFLKVSRRTLGLI